MNYALLYPSLVLSRTQGRRPLRKILQGFHLTVSLHYSVGYTRPEKAIKQL